MWCSVEKHRYLTSLFLSYHGRLVIEKSNLKVSFCRTNVLQTTPLTRGQKNNVFRITRKFRSSLVTLACLKTQKGIEFNLEIAEIASCFFTFKTTPDLNSPYAFDGGAITRWRQQCSLKFLDLRKDAMMEFGGKSYFNLGLDFKIT